MSEKKRPTCVTVIGWVWVALGAFMCFSAVMGLFASLMIHQMANADPKINAEMPTFVRLFPLLAVTQVGVAILAIASGINFLNLKLWARGVLEGLTWFFLLFVVGFSIFWVVTWCLMSSRYGPPGFAIFGAVMGIACLAFYGGAHGNRSEVPERQHGQGGNDRNCRTVGCTRQGIARRFPLWQTRASDSEH